MPCTPCDNASMSAAIPRLAASEDEYLRRELESPEKHEYVHGEIVAMAGGTARHALICANVAGALRGLLKARPCVVLSSDQRISISAAGTYAYPDISVLCGKPVFRPKDANTLSNPVVDLAVEPRERVLVLPKLTLPVASV